MISAPRSDPAVAPCAVSRAAGRRCIRAGDCAVEEVGGKVSLSPSPFSGYHIVAAPRRLTSYKARPRPRPFASAGGHGGALEDRVAGGRGTAAGQGVEAALGPEQGTATAADYQQIAPPGSCMFVAAVDE